MPMEVEEEDGWKKVENLFERAMRDKKQDIIIKLTVIYQKKDRVNDEELKRWRNHFKERIKSVYSLSIEYWIL